MFCFLHQWRISRHLDSDRPLPRRTRRHLARCRPCRTFYEHATALGERLTEQAGQVTAAVSPALHEKILRRCRQQPAAERTPASGRFARLRPRLALAAAVALPLIAAVVIYLIYLSRPPTDPGPPVVELPPPSSPGGNDSPIVMVYPSDLSARATAAIETVVQRPTEREIRLLGQDGRAAAEFLLACLPVEVQLPAEPPMR